MICCSPDDIAQWINDGESFVIKNPERFEREVIPKFFKHNKFTSFVRVSNTSASVSLSLSVLDIHSI